MKLNPYLKTAVIALVALTLLPAAAWAQTGVMFVKNNRVGVGIANPATTFHLAAPGQAQFLFESTTLLSKYNFKINGNGFLVVSRLGSAGAEVQIRKANDEAGATMSVLGSISATNVAFSSARDLKESFVPMDSREVLAKVAELPISEWNYKADPKAARHIGPMAEDFHAAFGVGNSERQITVSDASGVALAAIQGLHAELQEKDQLILELVERIERLERGAGR